MGISDMREMSARVLGALMRCGLTSGCGGCPYLLGGEEDCLAQLHREARAVILELDRLVDMMDEDMRRRGNGAETTKEGDERNVRDTDGAAGRRDAGEAADLG